jgi:hypothetical protein
VRHYLWRMEEPDLYGLPLDEFTAARDAEAKRLRADGDAEAAKEVKALRKPSRSAWAINRAVRAEPGAMQDLVDAGARLARAQDSALSGRRGGGDDLRNAVAAQGEAIERLTAAAARELGSSRGPHVDRVRETLRAVAGDDELRAEVEAGTVTRDHEASGFGGVAPDAVAKPRGRKKAPAARDDDARRRRQLETAVKRARHSLELATNRHADAQRRRDRAQTALDDAEGAVKEAERERRESAAELERAEAERDRVSR